MAKNGYFLEYSKIKYQLKQYVKILGHHAGQCRAKIVLGAIDID